MSISVSARQRVTSGLWGGRKAGSFEGREEVAPPTPDVSVTPSLGGARFDKRRRGKVVRFSDFETREAYEAAIRQAIPIPRPKVVESAEDLDEEDFIIVNLLGLLND